MANYYEEDEGIHFAPSDQELINDYLIPKRDGNPYDDVIATKDVYAKEPWSVVDHTNDPFFLEDEWYYFTPRNQISVKKIGCGKNSKRKITGDNDGIDRGFWKQNSKENIIDEETRNIIGVKQNLTYYTSNKKKLKREDGASAIVPDPSSQYSWIMTEYMLPEHMLPEEDKFQKLVLCKIHRSKKSKNEDDLHESSASSDQQQPTIINSVSVVAASLEIPHVAYPCSAAETERNREQSGEANMFPHIDAHSMTERVPEDKDEHVGPRHDLIGDVFNILKTMNGSSLRIEEGGNTPSTDQILLAQFTSLCSTKSYQRS